MPVWPIFNSKKSTEQTDESQSMVPSSLRSQDQQDLANCLLSNISTNSSVTDIIKTVSVANAAAEAISITKGSSIPFTIEPQASSKHYHQPKTITNKCICCGTHLKVPTGLPYFKCK